MELLANTRGTACPLVADAYDGGIWLYVAGYIRTNERALRDCGYSSEFVTLFQAAATQGHTHLLLDCDGPIIPDLPMFDW